MTRVASFAQVTFSDAVLIQYGTGVGGVKPQATGLDDDTDDDHDAGKDVESGKAFECSTINCPVLEFRVLNNLQKTKGGEIIDARMNIVASIDAGQAVKKKRKKSSGKKRAQKCQLRSSEGTRLTNDLEICDLKQPTQEEMRVMSRQLSSKLVDPIETAEAPQPKKEDSEKVFVKISIESQDHPFFRRLWSARHALDQDSPLLLPEARNLIRLNGGKWPVELNSVKAIRRCLRFDQLIVSLSGTSNVDSNSVYAQKIYGYGDTCVGYRFCNALSHDQNGCLVVDPDRLNVVQEQVGGGGEQLDVDKSRHVKDIFVL